MTLPAIPSILRTAGPGRQRSVGQRIDDGRTQQHGMGSRDGTWNVCDRAAIGKSGQRLDGDHRSLDLMQPHGRKMAGRHHRDRLKYLPGDSACVS